LVSAWKTDFQEEFQFFKEKFNWPDFKVEQEEASLVFFWHNGLGPVKDEWSVNFAIDHENDNAFLFRGENVPVAFPYSVDSRKDRIDLTELEMFRVAFPRYVERPVYFSSASIEANDSTYSLELAEDINKVAFKSLQERMALEFSKSLLRAALKKAAEKSARKEDEGFGALLGMVNAMTEKADTRNWQTLPHSILYTRIPLHAGKNEVRFLQRTSEGSIDPHEFTYNARQGQTLFHTFSTLESKPANRY
jgi:hypothetical protein